MKSKQEKGEVRGIYSKEKVEIRGICSKKGRREKVCLPAENAFPRPSAYA